MHVSNQTDSFAAGSVSLAPNNEEYRENWILDTQFGHDHSKQRDRLQQAVTAPPLRTRQMNVLLFARPVNSYVCLWITRLLVEIVVKVISAPETLHVTFYLYEYRSSEYENYNM